MSREGAAPWRCVREANENNDREEVRSFQPKKPVHRQLKRSKPPRGYLGPEAEKVRQLFRSLACSFLIEGQFIGKD